mmetsp:Transcript_2677/g.2324  ORF Transcript_2677/g.2324 Transcript_2677/m.2324 type:complete len:285 (+) Transcript_2677:681-1535(+)
MFSAGVDWRDLELNVGVIRNFEGNILHLRSIRHELHGQFTSSTIEGTLIVYSDKIIVDQDTVLSGDQSLQFSRIRRVRKSIGLFDNLALESDFAFTVIEQGMAFKVVLARSTNIAATSEEVIVITKEIGRSGMSTATLGFGWWDIVISHKIDGFFADGLEIVGDFVGGDHALSLHHILFLLFLFLVLEGWVIGFSLLFLDGIHLSKQDIVGLDLFGVSGDGLEGMLPDSVHSSVRIILEQLLILNSSLLNIRVPMLAVDFKQGLNFELKLIKLGSKLDISIQQH